MPPKYTRPKSKKRKPKAKAKNARARKAKFRPRNTIRTAPTAAPNVYNFKRTYDHPLSVGVADTDNGVYMNSDSTWQIIKLHTKFSTLKDHLEFTPLFRSVRLLLLGLTARM